MNNLRKFVLLMIRTFLYIGLFFFLYNCKKDDTVEVSEEIIIDNRIINIETNLIVKEGFPGTFEMQRLGRQQPIADFEPTGISIGPKMTIKIEVDVTKGNSFPRLLLGTYSRYESFWNPQDQALVQGENTVVNNEEKERLIYIRYVGENPNSEARITIKGGFEVPFYKLGETKNEDFVSMLDECNCPNGMLQGDKTIVVAGVNSIQKYRNQDWEQLMLTLDNIITTEAQIDGLDSSLPVHIPNRNRYLFTESDNPDYWMAATWYRTFYNQKDAIDFVLDVNKLKNDGWGPWHELGHQHQLNNLTWDQVIEVTVNIYSLAVERSFGLNSRLKRDNIWALVDDYFNIPVELRNYNSESVGLFLRLALYHQLWLQYGDNFFIDLHKKVREEGIDLDTNEAKMAYFMLKASEVTQNNLKGFFKKWGFVLNDQDFEALDALGLPDPSIDITELRE